MIIEYRNLRRRRQYILYSDSCASRERLESVCLTLLFLYFFETCLPNLLTIQSALYCIFCSLVRSVAFQPLWPLWPETKKISLFLSFFLSFLPFPFLYTRHRRRQRPRRYLLLREVRDRSEKFMSTVFSVMM